MGETTFRLGNTHKVAYTASAGNSSKVGKNTTKVRVWCSTDAYIKIGDGVTATTNDAPVGASIPECFDISPGERVSAVKISNDGNLHVTELSK